MSTLFAADSRFIALLRRPVVRIFLSIVAGGMVLYALYALSRHNYLMFHWLTEGFSVVIAFAIFAIAWNSRRFTENRFFLLVGIAFVFIGGLDFLHAVTYKGSGVFFQFGSNPATQLWVAARYMEALTFLAATFLVTRRLNGALTVLVCKRLAEAHGGRIWVDSAPGEGATFSVALPFRW